MTNLNHITAKGMPATAALRAPMLIAAVAAALRSAIGCVVHAMAFANRFTLLSPVNQSLGFVGKETGNGAAMGYANPRYRIDNSLESARIKLR